MVEAADGQLDASGGLDLNSVEVDDLRAIGLSLNQAVRVVVQRDRRGGFAPVDEVDRLQGLPREIKEQLKLFTGV